MLLLPDKAQYRAGETIKLRVSGAAKETVTLTSGLFRRGAQAGESREITLGAEGRVDASAAGGARRISRTRPGAES